MSIGILFPTNEYAAATKPSEQIQKLILPDCKNVQDVLVHIVTKGLPQQYPYLYKYMYKLYKPTLAFVCSNAASQIPQNQIMIAQSFLIILQKQVGRLTLGQMQLIFETCLQCLNNLQSTANDYMSSVLQATIKIYPDNKKLLKRLQDVALDLGKPTQPIISKVTSGRLISILSKYSRKNIKGEMVDILKRVLADNEIEARKMWLIDIFPRILQNMDIQFIQLHLQEKLYECVWSDNQEIGLLALEIILKNATKFSTEQQFSRIIKLFIDSLTSKHQKIVLMVTQIMGEVYQKLLNVILKNEDNCVKFWKSLIEVSQSKNEKILNNFIYNLPGILILSAPLYKVDPICDIYVELFYEAASNKLLLASYFHEMVRLFPSKKSQLKQIVYWMFNELFQQAQPLEEGIKILNKIMFNLSSCYQLFLVDSFQAKEQKTKREEQAVRYFDITFCEHLMKYLTVLLKKKNGSWLNSFYMNLKSCSDYYNPEFLEQILLPNLYSLIRQKTPSLQLVVQFLIQLVCRDGNHLLINNYLSKVNIQLTKSTKSYERQAALILFCETTKYLSIDLCQQYRIGEKFLSFNNDKIFKIKNMFIRYLPKMIYYLTREEKLQYSIIVTRLNKDSDPEIQSIMNELNFLEDQNIKQEIVQKSNRLKENQKNKKNVQNNRKQQSLMRRSSKDIKKLDVTKKRIQTTKGKNKILIKQIPKKKTVVSLMKTATNLLFTKNS